MKQLLLKAGLALGLVFSCLASAKENFSVYVWEHAPKAGKQEAQLKAQMEQIKAHGVKGVFYHSNFNEMAQIKLAAKLAAEIGLEFHAWIPTLVQADNPDVKASWHAVSREGYSSKDKPAYVPYYQFLCPNNEEVFAFLAQRYAEVARMEGVTGVHLDYIRFPDVILARGLWSKYGLTMNEEMPPYDYCYCDKCVAKFKEQSGLDIREKGDAAAHDEQWCQFRYDSITRLVNRLVKVAHGEGKKISAAVFPGPTLSKKMVRQDWGQWKLDTVAPMIYNDFYLKPPHWVGEQTAEGVAAKMPSTRFLTGLFICGQPEKKAQIKDPEGHGLIPSELPTALRAARENGASGVVFFTFSSMTPAHWQKLREFLGK